MNILFVIMFVYAWTIVGFSIFGVFMKSVQQGMGVNEYIVLPALMFIFAYMTLEAIHKIL